MIHDTQSAEISQKQDECNINVIMKTMCPPGYHHNGFAATHALGHITVNHVPKCMSCHKAIVVITGRTHCFHDYIYICMFEIASYKGDNLLNKRSELISKCRHQIHPSTA